MLRGGLAWGVSSTPLERGSTDYGKRSCRADGGRPNRPAPPAWSIIPKAEMKRGRYRLLGPLPLTRQRRVGCATSFGDMLPRKRLKLIH